MAISKATRNWIIETAREFNIMEAELFNALMINEKYHLRQGKNKREALKLSKENIIKDLKRKREEGV